MRSEGMVIRGERKLCQRRREGIERMKGQLGRDAGQRRKAGWRIKNGRKEQKEKMVWKRDGEMMRELGRDGKMVWERGRGKIIVGKEIYGYGGWE